MFKKIFSFVIKNVWFFIFLGIIFFFFYQNLFSWSEEEKITQPEKVSIEQSDVAFLTINEYHYGVQEVGFDQLHKSLVNWNFDEENKKVELRFENQLPGPLTKLVAIYDREFDASEKYSKVVSVFSFPYNYYFKKQPLLSFHSLDEYGTLYLIFENQNIKLEANEKYESWKLEGKQLVKTVIKNHGIYKKEFFSTMKPNIEE